MWPGIPAHERMRGLFGVPGYLAYISVPKPSWSKPPLVVP